MKTRLFTSFLAAAVLLLFALSFAQTTTPPVEHGSNFVDANGDGYNDNAPDADGDGIPNGQDPDYIKPADGSGAGRGKARAPEQKALSMKMATASMTMRRTLTATAFPTARIPIT